MLLMICAMGCYMAALQLLAVTPPGSGPIGSLMLVLPGDFMEWMHAPAYGLLAWLTVVGLQRRGWPMGYAATVGLSFALLFGLWTEVAQASVPGREPSLKDVAVDGAGILLAGILIGRNSLRLSTLRRALAWSGIGAVESGL